MHRIDNKASFQLKILFPSISLRKALSIHLHYLPFKQGWLNFMLQSGVELRYPLPYRLTELRLALLYLLLKTLKRFQDSFSFRELEVNVLESWCFDCRLSNYGFVWLVFSQWHLSSGASPLRLRSTPLLSLSSLPFELASFQFLHRDSRVAVQYLMWLIQGVQIQTALPGMKGHSNFWSQPYPLPWISGMSASVELCSPLGVAPEKRLFLFLNKKGFCLLGQIDFTCFLGSTQWELYMLG